MLFRNVSRCLFALLPACTGWVMLGDSSGTGGDASVRDAMPDVDVFDATDAPEAGPAALSVTPSSHDFGSVAYTQMSGAFSFTVNNAGGEATGTLSVAITGPNAANFAQTNDCPTTLGAGASCAVSVTVTPDAVDSLAATLNVSASPGAAPRASLAATGDYAYGNLWDTTKWATFESGAQGFNGAAFDGRYLYLVPYESEPFFPDGAVVRYDTKAPFSVAGSWSTFFVSTVDSNAKGFNGAAFDGRYVYLVPSAGLHLCGPGCGTWDVVVARYDTQGAFVTAGSWSTFDITTTINANDMGFSSATFDGRYVYFFGYAVARYDTQAPFGAAGSWSTFDFTTINPVEMAQAAVFDGRYLYLVGAGVARYDTQGPFSTPGSWSTFDVGDGGAPGFNTAAFDGRYVYSVSGAAAVTRYDTQAPFEAPGSWSVFDLSAFDPAAGYFAGAAFDGRYLYFVPSQSTDRVARYDTQAPLDAFGSWSTFDVSTVANPPGYFGAAFDGRYVYLVPFFYPYAGSNGVMNGLVARFDAKQPPSLPRLCSSALALYCDPGSFY